MARKTLTRRLIVTGTLLAIAAALALAFWPRPLIVDLGTVSRGDVAQSIAEKGRTRVAEAFVVSTPVNGRLLRVEVHPGDAVTRGETVVARMRPANPAVLDARTRAQTMAAVEAAEAGLRVAEATLEAARADADLMRSDLERTEQLARSGTASVAALDRMRGAARAAEARLHTAEAAIAQRRAELESVQAQLIDFDSSAAAPATAVPGDDLVIRAPSDGTILRVFHEDETTLAAGAPILEVGDIADGLEVVADLISTDAVAVRPGLPVLIENWGGGDPLAGEVTRISPSGETRVSALGVEEQRVEVVIRLTTPPEDRSRLGHGYAVDARIIVARDTDALRVPSSALVRRGDGWGVFVVEDGQALLRDVTPGIDNGQWASLRDGVAEGTRVVLYPGAQVFDGASVTERIVAD